MSQNKSSQSNLSDSQSSDGSGNALGWFQRIIRERGLFFRSINPPQDRAPWYVTILLIAVAYCLSFWVRLEWIDFAQSHYENEKGEIVYFHPDMVKDGVALPNTHDSFYFGSILQKAHLGLHENNNLIPSALRNGMITMLPYWLLQLFPDLTIEMLLLWIPVYVAGIVCVPLVLIGRLYGSHAWGFFAACLAGVTHSYYNRTLAGYYDTDMFSITIPAFALYFLFSASRRKSLNFALCAALTLYLYRFFYASGQAITGALAVAYIGYSLGLVFLEYFFTYSRNLKRTFSSSTSLFIFKSVFLISFAAYAEAWSYGIAIQSSPGKFLLGLFFLPVLRILFGLISVRTEEKVSESSEKKEKSQEEKWNSSPKNNPKVLQLPSIKISYLVLPVVTVIFSLFALSSGDVRGKIFAKLDRYVSAGKGVSVQSQNKEKGYSLSYLDVFSTVKEASEIPKEVVRNRILADSPTCSCARCFPAADKKDAFIFPTAIFGLLGVVFLIFRYWEFCFAVPFLAIAHYCFEGEVGLRFTVHVGNIAALGITFLIFAVVRWLLYSPFAAKVWKLIKPGAPDDHLDELKKFPKFLKFFYWGICLFFLFFLIRPNINHAQNYHSGVVYPTKTIEVLNKLNEVSQPDDFVVTWWDYGSGCWFYGNTRTFTSPAHQTFDNFLSSEILRSRKPERARNLARLKTETYVDIQEKKRLGEPTYGTAVQAIFKDGKPDLEFYQGVLHDLEKGTYSLPPQTRDIFLFLPYEILRIFPTILSFSSRNLFFPRGQSGLNNDVREPPMKILKNGRKEGFSYNFDEGFRFDQYGNLRVEGEQSGVIPYSQLWSTSGNNGDPARVVQSVDADGFRILSKPDPRSSRALLFIEKTGELIILSSGVLNSTFAKRFLLDKFDEKAYFHPKFVDGANQVRRPFMAQVNGLDKTPSGLALNLGGGYIIEVDMKTFNAKIPGSKGNVPFAFHRKLLDPKSGKMIKLPSQQKSTPKFHLFETSIPRFTPGGRYTIPAGGQTVSQIAASNRLSSIMLEHYLGRSADEKVDEETRVEIPAKGYEMTRAWFFMDQEAFESLLVQGFLMENLDENYFEKIYSSPWGKIYRFKR